MKNRHYTAITRSLNRCFSDAAQDASTTLELLHAIREDVTLLIDCLESEGVERSFELFESE